MKERLMIIRLVTQLMWLRNYMAYRGVIIPDGGVDQFIAGEIEEARALVDWFEVKEGKRSQD